MNLKIAINKKNISEIRKITRENIIPDIVNMLENLTKTERVIYFRLLNTEKQSEIFSALKHNFQKELARDFSNKEIKGIIKYLYANEIADLIEDVSDELAKKILLNIDKETRSDINKILKYTDNQTGSVMIVDIATAKQSETIENVIKMLKSKRDEIELVHHFFVVNNKNKLVGYISLEDLLFNQSSQKIKNITKPVGYVYTTTNKEKAALTFANYDMSVLPVVNKSKEVIGMITSEDVIDIVQDAATEDMNRMAGIQTESSIQYSKTSIKTLFKSRVFWILLLMISATLSQIVLDFFQDIAHNKITTISITTAIIAILPIISGAAGNAGSQASTTVIRALSTSDITTKDYFKVFLKELKISILIGLTLGIANFLRLLIYYMAKGNINDTNYLFISLAASISLFVVIILAKVVGGMLPIFAQKLKWDPAAMAAPLLTTLIDALSTLIFFGISIGIMILVI